MSLLTIVLSFLFSASYRRIVSPAYLAYLAYPEALAFPLLTFLCYSLCLLNPVTEEVLGLRDAFFCDVGVEYSDFPIVKDCQNSRYWCAVLSESVLH